MDNQTLLDIQVLCMPAPAVLDSIERHLQAFDDMGEPRHLQIVQMLVHALDNRYGPSTYAEYKISGEKFW